MKTQIVQLEPHDDLVSTRDKMGWDKTGRILLVWPERGVLLTRRLDLVLLQRHSQFLGAQMALVTQDPEVRFHARQLRIPIFSSLRRAQTAHWRASRLFHLPHPLGREAVYETGQANAAQPALSQPPPGRTWEKGTVGLAPGSASPIVSRPHVRLAPLPPLPRLVVFTLGVLAVLAITAVLLPSAEIRLSPHRRLQEISLRVKASPDREAVKLSGEIPARRVTVVVEGRDELDASGTINFPTQASSGQVVFTNLTDQAVPVPEGVILRTQGSQPLLFETAAAGEVPAGPGEVLTVTVAALAPGWSGNLPAGRLAALEGPLGTQLSVANPKPMRGGEEARALAPSPADRRRLYDRLLSALRRTALEEIRGGLDPGDVLVPASLEVRRKVEESYFPAGEQPADRLELSLRLEFEALVIAGDDLRALSTAVLDANLPAGFAPQPGSLRLAGVEEPQMLGSSIDPGAGSTVVQWELRARRQIQARLPAEQLTQLILGQTQNQAQNRLEATLPLDAPAQIRLHPTWWPRLPLVPFRIQVEIEGIEEPGAGDHPTSLTP